VEPPHGRSVWGRLAGWAILIAIPLGLYFGLSPVRHVVDATARAASTSIHLEISPPDPGDEPSYWELAGSSTDSVMPKRNRGKVFESLLGWLEVARPRLSFKQRLNELDVLDDMLVEAASEIPYFAEIPKITDDSEDHNKPRIGALCTAGDPSKPYLVVALVGGEDSSVTCTFAISWRDGDYYYQLITNPKSIAPKTSGARSREPELKAVDLDMDGRAEVIETWRGRSGRLMHVQIYKWFPSKPRWRRMSNVSNI